MHTLARPLVRERPQNIRRGRSRAFTLIELLVVIAIIGILAAITFGVVTGVRGRAAISLAKGELSVLSQSLENYKRQYGDYPQAGGTSNNPEPGGSLTLGDAPCILFNALSGKLGPKLTPINGRSLLDISKFSTESIAESDMPALGNKVLAANALVDPWGRRYLYYYRELAQPWTENANYILLSAGPDGEMGIEVNPTTGVLTISNEGVAADNIYANQ